MPSPTSSPKAPLAAALAVGLALLPARARADAPEFRLDGFAAWQLFWYPKALPPPPETEVAWQPDAGDSFPAVRDLALGYATHRNQLLFQPRLKARWNEAGAVAEVQFRHDFADPRRSRILLKDLYADLRVGAFYAAAGNQIVRWGRMDVFSPMDVLPPRDYDEPFFPEPLAAPAIQVRYSWPALSIQGVLLPGFVPSLFPAFAPSRWDVLIPQPQAVPQPGGDFEVPAYYRAIDDAALTAIDDPDPDDGIEPLEHQAGLRAELSLGPGDLALSLYRGRDHLPSWYTFEVVNAPAIDSAEVLFEGAHVALTPWYAHVSVVGVDGSLVVGPVVLKGEAAYTVTADPDHSDCAADDPYLRWAAGAEYVKNDLVAGMGLAVRLEVTGDHEIPPSDDGRRNTEGQCLEDDRFPDVVLYDPKHLNAFAWGGQIAWTFTPSLVLDLRGYGSVERDYMLRGELRYTFQDKVRISAAGLLVGGAEDGIAEGRPGYFWWYRDNDRVELAVSYLF